MKNFIDKTSNFNSAEISAQFYIPHNYREAYHGYNKNNQKGVVLYLLAVFNGVFS